MSIKCQRLCFESCNHCILGLTFYNTRFCRITNKETSHSCDEFVCELLVDLEDIIDQTLEEIRNDRKSNEL